MMRWVITGGCGFLGVNLINRLVREKGHEILVLDNLSVGTRADLASVAPFQEGALRALADLSGKATSHGYLVVGDILDYEQVLDCTRGADVIVHLAANTGVGPSVENPRMDLEANIRGTFNCLEAARFNGVRRFIFASSGAPVGEVEPPIHENVVPRPISPYGASKLAGEAYCSVYARTYGIETVALRFGNVYGPRSHHKGSVVAKFVRRALEGAALEVYGDGGQTRDFIFVDDLVEAIMQAVRSSNVAGEIFQIATARETSISELVASLMLAFRDHSIFVPEVIYSGVRKGDVRRNFSDTSKARLLLNWEPSTSLAEGLAKTIEWFISTKHIPPTVS